MSLTLPGNFSWGEKDSSGVCSGIFLSFLSFFYLNFLKALIDFFQSMGSGRLAFWGVKLR